MLSLFANRFPAVPTAGLYDGVDVSGWQAPSLWSTFGWVKWSCCKITEGANFTELAAIDHSIKARDRGVPWGLYHFAKFGNVDAEAARYLAGVDTVARNVGRAPWFHMLDLEAPASGDVTAWSERWCQIVQAASPLPVIVYTGPGWANQHLLQRGTGLERRPLWVAHYANAGTTEPWLPAIWSDWMIWQWSSSTALGSLDVNVAKQSFMDLVHGGDLAPAATQGDDDMFTDDDRALLAAVHGAVASSYPPFGRPANSNDVVYVLGTKLAEIETGLTQRIAEVLAKVAALPAGAAPAVTAASAHDIAVELITQLNTNQGA